MKPQNLLSRGDWRYNDDQNRSIEIKGDALGSGKMYENRVFVRVRWAWLALPISLVTMTAVLTIATILRSSNQKMPVWGNPDRVRNIALDNV